MTIQYFAEHQTDVFVPALVAVAVAVVLVVLPVVLASTVRRARRGRLLVTVSGVLAAIALVAAGQQTSTGLATLGAQRDRVAAELRSGYGLRVDAQQARSLVDGGAVVLPAAGRAPVRLRQAADGTYVVTVGERLLPRQA